MRFNGRLPGVASKKALRKLGRFTWHLPCAVCLSPLFTWNMDAMLEAGQLFCDCKIEVHSKERQAERKENAFLMVPGLLSPP